MAIALAASCLAILGASPAGPIADKTLVAWVYLADRAQRGGSVITLDNRAGAFDGIVYGELHAGRWMGGSDFFRRTPREQAAWPEETAAPGERVAMAAVYRGREVTLYRNGRQYAHYTVDRRQEFGPASAIVLGLRHLDAGDRACFVGDIEEARVYEVPLDDAAVERLTPGRITGPKPAAWWTFRAGRAVDRMGRFPPGRLFGAATIERGRLHLPGGVAYMVAGAQMPVERRRAEWPAYHVTALPDEGVACPYDANGCIWWKGRYHLMYIYQDPARPAGGHCWGHMSSVDLVNWTVHPPALAPEPGDPDVGIFSGNAFVNKDGVPMLCWFGVDAGVCVATAEDDSLIRWRKHPSNPIIPIPKAGEPGHGVYTVWDPYLWLEDGLYRCLLGGNKLPDGKDTLYLCTSPDLTHWTPAGPFYQHADAGWTESDEDCSCPDYFRLGDRRVLLCISHKVGARCYIGRGNGERFVPEQHVRMNWPGGMCFAPETLQAPDGRRIMWAWVTDPRVRPTQNATGSGAMCLPRVLSLGDDGALRTAPAAELRSLRRAHSRLEAIAVPADGDTALQGLRGDCMELAVEIDPGQAREVGLKVRCSPDGAEETGIWFDRDAGRLYVDMARSTLRTDVTYGQPPFASYGFQSAADNPHPYSRVEAPLKLGPGERLRLRVFLDRPLLEVFANDRQCITQQVFPSRADSVGVKVCARGGTATVRAVEAWQMAAARFVDRRGGPARRRN